MDKKARGNPRESDVTNGPKENGWQRGNGKQEEKVLLRKQARLRFRKCQPDLSA